MEILILGFWSQGPREQTSGATRARKNARGSRHLLLHLLLEMRVFEAQQPALDASDGAAACCRRLQQRGRSLWPRKAEPHRSGRQCKAGQGRVEGRGSRHGRPLRRLVLLAAGWMKESNVKPKAEKHRRVAFCFPFTFSSFQDQRHAARAARPIVGCLARVVGLRAGPDVFL